VQAGAGLCLHLPTLGPAGLPAGCMVGFAETGSQTGLGDIAPPCRPSAALLLPLRKASAERRTICHGEVLDHGRIVPSRCCGAAALRGWQARQHGRQEESRGYRSPKIVPTRKRSHAIAAEVLVHQLPPDCDLSLLGLERSELADVATVGGKHAAMLYRVVCADGRTLILKWFTEEGTANEVSAYALLARCCVPVLPLLGHTERALLLEDLTSSDNWRLARDQDMEDVAVGAAVARWYRSLHAAGREILLTAPHEAAFLCRETDVLDQEAMSWTGEKLGLHHQAWRLASANAGPLREAMRALPETLNYNDFHWSNLALSRHYDEAPQAIVYDYHLLGIGPAYSDYRNVLTAMREPATSAFRESYGFVDAREATLDAPISIIVALITAARRPVLPSWAKVCVQAVADGSFERDLERAMALL